MGRLQSAFYTVLALGIVGAVVWAIIRGVEKQPSTVGALATAGAAIAVVVAQRNFEKRRDLERAHREEMTPIYEELVSTLKDIESRDPNDLGEFFKNLQTKLIIYGPTPVLMAWLAWQRRGIPDDEQDPTSLLAYERVLLAIRADLGHDNSGLSPGDLLRTYVNDIDEMIIAWNLMQAQLPPGTG